MRTVTTRPRALPTLYLAFELGNTEWVLAMTTGIDQTPLRRALPARALKTLDIEIARAKAHFGLSPTAPVCSCYEAGRDGFWLHRYLVSRGIANRIVDSSSIEVNRRRRRTKTDRLDAAKLVTMLVRAEGGEQKVWSVVHVPTSVEEDRRQVHRELLFARRDRGRHTNRMKGLLAGQGVPLAKLREFPAHVRTARRWDGTPLPPLPCARLQREWETMQAYTTRIRALKHERRALLRITDDPAIAPVRQLNQLCGVGIDSAWLYVMEFFAWRQFAIAVRWADSPGSRTRTIRVATCSTNREFRRQAIAGCVRSRLIPRGRGCAFSPRVSSRAGTRRNLGQATAGFERLASSP